MTRKPS